MTDTNREKWPAPEEAQVLTDKQVRVLAASSACRLGPVRFIERNIKDLGGTVADLQRVLRAAASEANRQSIESHKGAEESEQEAKSQRKEAAWFYENSVSLNDAYRKLRDGQVEPGEVDRFIRKVFLEAGIEATR